MVAAYQPSPFAWMAIATPAGGAAQAALDESAEEFRAGTNFSRLSAEKRVETERADGRYRELDRATATGIWQLRLLVGAADPVQLAETSSLLVAAASVAGLPYRLELSGGHAPLSAVWPRTEAPDGGQSFLVSSSALDHIARPPSREIGGFRSIDLQPFDMTAEADRTVRLVADAPTDGVHVGYVVDQAHQNVGEMVLSQDSLVRHTFVCGATGSGKSQTVRVLLEELTRLEIPWLVIEPVKAEYAGMAGRLEAMKREAMKNAAGEDPSARASRLDEKVHVVRLGVATLPPTMLNPLEPEPGFPLQSHLDLVLSIFTAAFDADDPLPQLLAEGLRLTYEGSGWDLVTGRHRFDGGDREDGRPSYPTLRDLEAAVVEASRSAGYQGEMLGNVIGFMRTRLRSLRQGSSGRFFEGGHRMDIGRLLDRNVVLEIESVGNDQAKAFVIGVVLTRIVEHLTVRAKQEEVGRRRSLSHVTVVEEAHRLLRTSPGPAAKVNQAVETFAAMLAEVRAYGEGLVVVEQIPTKVIPDVIKNTATRIMHRLPATDDREVVGGSMNMSPVQSAYAVSLEPGEAAVFSDEMDRPTLVRVHDHLAAESARGLVSEPLSLLVPVAQAPEVHRCSAVPCSAEALEHATHVVDGSRDLSIWAEAIFISWIIGDPMPAMKAGLRKSVAELDHGGEDCIAAKLVEAVVGRRRPILSRLVGVTALEREFQAATLAVLRGGEPSAFPTTVEPGWDRTLKMLEIDQLVAGAIRPKPARLTQLLRPDPESTDWSWWDEVPLAVLSLIEAGDDLFYAVCPSEADVDGESPAAVLARIRDELAG